MEEGEPETTQNPEVVVETVDGAIALESEEKKNEAKDGAKNEETPAQDESAVSKEVEEEDDFNVDAATLVARGTRKGSRFAADGTPLFLRAFLESASSDLHFYFYFKEDPHEFQPLENDVERRVIGKKTKYEMHEGEFRLPEPFSSSAKPYQGRTRERIRYKLADLYHLKVDNDMQIFVGIMPGKKIPFITDLNPHQLGLVDTRRIVFLPFSEEKNTMMELPNSPDMFFTTQIVSGGEVFIVYDKALRKYNAILVNQVYIPSKDNLLTPEDVSWRRAVENQAFVERILHMLVASGTNLEILIRVSPATPHLHISVSSGGQTVHPAQQRIDNYFRDEIVASRGNLRSYYYEEETIVYGFHDDGEWKFGLKDRSNTNGHKIWMKSPNSLYIYLEPAVFPL